MRFFSVMKRKITLLAEAIVTGRTKSAFQPTVVILSHGIATSLQNLSPILEVEAVVAAAAAAAVASNRRRRRLLHRLQFRRMITTI